MKIVKKPSGALPWTAFAVLTAFQMSQTAQAAGTITIPAPCNAISGAAATTSPNAFLRSCSSVINGTASAAGSATSNTASSASATPPGILSLVQSRIQQQEGCYYSAGVELNTATGTAACSGDFFGYPCSVNPVPLFGISSSEITSDHNGRTCGGDGGKYLTATNLSSSSSCPQPAAPAVAATANPSQSQLQAMLEAPPYNLTLSQISSMNEEQLTALEKQIEAASPGLISQAQSGQKICVFANSIPPYGEIERSWARGGWIQALAYYENQVLNELSCTHSITMSTDPSVNACASLAQDTLNQVTSEQQASNNVVTALKGQSNISDIVYCNGANSSGGTDAGSVRQSAQHLCASRANVESLFTQLVVCDIFQKAKTAYETQVTTYNADPITPIPAVGPNGMQAAFLNALAQQVQPVCRPICKSKKSMSSALSCTNTCYSSPSQGNISKHYQNVFNNMWPLNQTNSCPSGSGTPFVPSTSSPSSSNQDPTHGSGVDPLFGFAVIAGSLGRKREAKERKKRDTSKSDTHSLKNQILFFLVVGILTAMGAGCGGGGAAQSAQGPNTNCPSGMGGQPSNCCGSDGSLIQPPPSGCASAGAGTGGLTSALAAGAGAAGGSGTENTAASTLASNSNTTGGGSLSGGDSSGVTASPSPTSAAADTSGVGPLSLPNVAGLGNASGSGGSGSGNSGGLGSAGDTTTDGAGAGVSGAAAGAAVTAAGDSTLYAGGGGAAPASTKAGAFGSGGGLNGASAEDKFGNGTNVNPMGGTDPANYFALTNIDDSIFKKVETRYRTKSMNWASSAAIEASGPKGTAAK